MEISTQEDHHIPIPLNITTYGNNTSGGHGHIIHHGHHHHQNHANPAVHSNNITTSNPLVIPLNGNNHDHYNHHLDHQHHVGYNMKKHVVKYKECLKNHAASMGGNATDGCGEFMPSGEDGSIEALTCSACNCHRNFHRRELEGEETFLNPYHNHHQQPPRKLMLTQYNHKIIKSPSPHQMIMPIGIATAATSNSDSEDLLEEGLTLRPPPPPPPPPYGYGGRNQKKRFRTKFSQAQKEKMLRFAERVGWKIQRQEESVVQEFCQEIGVRRRVLKVWMHNNKHNLSKKNDDNNVEISGNNKDVNDTNVASSTP